MQKYVPYIFGFFLVACVTACGSSGTSTAAVALYAPLPFAPYSTSSPNRLVGGAVQGGTLALATAASVTVSTLAGTAGTSGFTNYSGNSSVTATFSQPNDVTTDGTSFYVADYGNSLIRQIYTDPVSLEVKTATLLCKDVSGTTISFSHPTGITTDGTYLYVADSGSNTIRVIEIAMDPALNAHKVITIGSATGLAGSVDSTDKTAALFNQPIGVTTDGASLFVTDFNNATVRWIDMHDRNNGNYAVYTLAGTSGVSGSDDGVGGAARFHMPGRITTDGKYLFVTDFYNRTIRKIVITTGEVSTIAGTPGQVGGADGTGPEARFNRPNGITTDGIYLYVTDFNLNTIRKIEIATGTVTTIPVPGGKLHAPIGITTDGHSLFVADTYLLNSDNTASYSNSILKIE